MRIFYHILSMISWCFLTGTASFAQDKAVETPKMVTERNTIEQWLQNERLINVEKLAWEEQKSHLSQLIALYKKELTLLDEELSEAGKNATLIDTEAEALKAKIAASEKARRQTISFLNRIKPRVIGLIARFPETLQNQLTDQSSILADTVINTNADAAFRAMIKVLQDAENFDRSYTIEEQKITLGDQDYHAKIMYFGLSRAYFLAGKKAGIAIPTTSGWVFKERNEIADELKHAFAIHSKEKPSSYFTVPLQFNSK